MDELRSLWRTRAFGDLSSALAFARSGLVFVAPDARRCNELVCVAPDDGAVRWRTESERVGDGVAIAADPAGQIYLAQGGGVECRADSDGKQRWTVTVASASGGSESFYPLTAPVIAGGLLILPSTVSRLVALALDDGRVAWRESSAPANAVQWLSAREQVLLSLGYDDLAAHDLATGKPLWTHPFSRRVSAMPALSASVGFTAPASGLAHVLDGDSLLALDLRSGAIRWRAATRGEARFTGNGKILILADGERRRGLDAQTGDVRWETPAPGPSLLAPLTDGDALLQSERSTALLDYATGRADVQQWNALGPRDQLLDARAGRAALLLGDDTRLFVLRDRRLFQSEIGQHPGVERLFDRTRADPRTVQALLHERWVAVYSKDHTLELFG